MIPEAGWVHVVSPEDAPPRTCRTAMRSVNRSGRPRFKWKPRMSAEEARRRAASDGGTAYDCPNCAFWHVGSDRRSE